MKEANVGGTIAEHTYRNAVGASIFVTQSQAGSDRQMGANDGMSAPKILFGTGHMHRAAAPPGYAGGFSQ